MSRRAHLSLSGAIGLIGLIGPIGVFAPGAAAAAAPAAIIVSGKVLGPHGQPAAAATVYVSVRNSADPFNGPETKPEVRQTIAAADGAFRLEMPAPSPHWWATVTAMKAGFGPGFQTTWPGGSRSGLALVLTEASFVAGRVVDAAGLPVAGARVKPNWIIPSEGDGGWQLPEAVLAPAVTDAQGKFRLAPLPAHTEVNLAVEDSRYVMPLGASGRARTGQGDLTIPVLPAGAITGRVVTGDGQPVAKVGVLCLTTGTVVPPETTDSQGRFRFSRLLPGAYLLLPEPREALAAFDGSTQRVLVAPGGQARCPDLTLTRMAGSATLSGKVTDATTGQPIADVGIDTQHQIASTGMLNMPIGGPMTWTGADGTYHMRLPPGTWYAYAHFLPPGYRQGPPPPGPAALPAAPGKSLTRDFTLTPDRDTVLVGQVLDAAGRPAPGAKLRAMPGGVLTTGLDGHFRMPLFVGPFGGPAAGMPLIRMAVLGLDRSQGVVLDLQPEAAKALRVIRLRRLPLVPGVVVDERGAPLPHVEVRVGIVLTRPNSVPDQFTTALAAATTDARGRFSLPLIPGAVCPVSAQPAGFVPAEMDLQLRPGKPPAPLKLRLRRGGGAIAGVVVDPEGRPLPGVQLTSFAPGPLYYSGTRFADVTSDRQGRFEMDHLPAGTVNVNAWLSGYYDDHRQNVRVGITHLRLTLAPMSQPQVAPTPLAVGASAPEIQAARWVNGAGVPSLAALRGKRVVLQFSSAYNPAAKESNAALAALAASLKAAGRDDVAILALYDSSASAADVEAYARSERLPFPIGRVAATPEAGLDNPTFWAYGVRRLPTVFLIDRGGIVRAVNPTREELTQFAAAAEGPSHEKE